MFVIQKHTQQFAIHLTVCHFFQVYKLQKFQMKTTVTKFYKFAMFLPDKMKCRSCQHTSFQVQRSTVSPRPQRVHVLEERGFALYSNRTHTRCYLKKKTIFLIFFKVDSKFVETSQILI
jgi:hypothetical protein